MNAILHYVLQILITYLDVITIFFSNIVNIHYNFLVVYSFSVYFVLFSFKVLHSFLYMKQFLKLNNIFPILLDTIFLDISQTIVGSHAFGMYESINIVKLNMTCQNTYF